MKFDGNLCRAARALLNLSNSDLAEAAGVGVNTLSRFERGTDVRLSTANAIQAALEARGAVFIAAGQMAGCDSVGVRRGNGAA